jgi:hypothetical protein
MTLFAGRCLPKHFLFALILNFSGLWIELGCSRFLLTNLGNFSRLFESSDVDVVGYGSRFVLFQIFLFEKFILIDLSILVSINKFIHGNMIVLLLLSLLLLSLSLLLLLLLFRNRLAIKI